MDRELRAKLVDLLNTLPEMLREKRKQPFTKVSDERLLELAEQAKIDMEEFRKNNRAVTRDGRKLERMGPLERQEFHYYPFEGKLPFTLTIRLGDYVIERHGKLDWKCRPEFPHVDRDGEEYPGWLKETYEPLISTTPPGKRPRWINFGLLAGDEILTEDDHNGITDEIEKQCKVQDDKRRARIAGRKVAGVRKKGDQR